MSAFDVIGSEEPDEELMESVLGTPAGMAGTAAVGDALLAEAAKADSNAFAELYERYYPRVYRYVYHRLGNPADAEDVTALIFMKTLEALPSYRRQRNGFAPWIFRISSNAVVDYYRRQRKQAPLGSLEPRGVSGDPLDDVLGAEQRRELQRLVEHLSPEQRDVVLLRYAADLTFSEIAATLQKN